MWFEILLIEAKENEQRPSLSRLGDINRKYLYGVAWPQLARTEDELVDEFEKKQQKGELAESVDKANYIKNRMDEEFESEEKERDRYVRDCKRNHQIPRDIDKDRREISVLQQKLRQLQKPSKNSIYGDSSKIAEECTFDKCTQSVYEVNGWRLCDQHIKFGMIFNEQESEKNKKGMFAVVRVFCSFEQMILYVFVICV